MRRSRILLVGFALLATAACGQKSGVAGTDAEGADEAAVETTAAPATTVAAGDSDTTAVAVETTAGETTETTVEAPVETTVAEPSGAHEAGPNDTAGVTDDEIVIGIHAPVTGASPIPQTSFDIGKDIYWKFLADSAPDELFGRKVRVVFRDDEFNPNRAVSVCREMVEQEGAFLLVGGGGADQITACAQYANDNGIPYISAGVNQTGLADLATYYAVTLAYAEQATMLLNEATAREFTEIGLVVTDTPSFDDAREAIVAAAEAAGVPIAVDIRISKDASEAEQLSTVQQLKDAGLSGVILLSSPVVFIGLANQGRNQGFEPTWLGPGVTSGLNAVTTFGCPAVANGVFFSPTPGLDVIDQLDPDFIPAYATYGDGAQADDIGLQLWSLNKMIALMFEATGSELGRAALMNTVEAAEQFDNGIYAPVRFTADDHFGGTGAHLLDADCDAQQYTTAAQFVAAG
jgi:branched-chain amino acid transport system substrate-binding protein